MHVEGLKDRAEAIRLNPTLPEAWFARGSAYYLLGEYLKAREDIQQAVRLRPSYQEAIALLNQTEVRLKEHASALPAPTPVAELGSAVAGPARVWAGEKTRVPTGLSAQDHEKLGRKLSEERNYEQAISELSEAVRQKPNLASAFNARGYAYLRMRDVGRAVADFNEALRIDPAYRNARQNLEAAQRTQAARR